MKWRSIVFFKLEPVSIYLLPIELLVEGKEKWSTHNRHSIIQSNGSDWMRNIILIGGFVAIPGSEFVADQNVDLGFS